MPERLQQALTAVHERDRGHRAHHGGERVQRAFARRVHEAGAQDRPDAAEPARDALGLAHEHTVRRGAAFVAERREEDEPLRARALRLRHQPARPAHVDAALGPLARLAAPVLAVVAHGSRTAPRCSTAWHPSAVPWG